MNLKTVLIPLAKHQQVDERYHQVLHLLQQCHVRCVLLHVIDDVNHVQDEMDLKRKLEVVEWVKAEREKWLKAESMTLQTKYLGLKVDYDVALGRPFQEIVSYADSNHCELIVIDANVGNKHHAVQYGSTTRHLMRKSPLPVWTISRQAEAAPIKVAVAVDVLSATDETIEFNRKLLRFGASIAAQLNQKVQLVHCWELYGEDYMRNWQRIAEMEIIKLAEKEQQHRLVLCQKLIDETGLSSEQVEIQLAHGEVVTAMPSYLSKQGVSLLIMGTVARTGIAGFFIGNTAESVLDEIECSVITLKPDGFVSPIL